MALIDINKCWVGVARRASERLGNRDSWYPQSYVRLSIEDDHFNLSPTNAKTLAKAITAAANLIDPPTPRKRKAA